MIDKSLVKRRFKKSFTTYDNNAVVQKCTAKELIKLLPSREFDYIFETGCATGILTKEIKQNLTFKKFCANDIVEEAKQYIDLIIPDNTFIFGDIEEIELKDKYDLIISNASLQWCNDIKSVIKKLYSSLNDRGILLFSVFSDNNLKEIKDIFNIKNKNYSINDLKDFIAQYRVEYYNEEEKELYFDTPLDVLKHLKLTGVNAVEEMKFTKKKLLNFETQYLKKYSKNNKVTLTYNPVNILITKSS